MNPTELFGSNRRVQMRCGSVWMDPGEFVSPDFPWPPDLDSDPARWRFAGSVDGNSVTMTGTERRRGSEWTPYPYAGWELLIDCPNRRKPMAPNRRSL